MAAAAYTEKHFRARKHPTARDPSIRDNEWRGINSSIGLRREGKNNKNIKALLCLWNDIFILQSGRENKHSLCARSVTLLNCKQQSRGIKFEIVYKWIFIVVDVE